MPIRYLEYRYVCKVFKLIFLNLDISDIAGVLASEG